MNYSRLKTIRSQLLLGIMTVIVSILMIYLIINSQDKYHQMNETLTRSLEAETNLAVSALRVPLWNYDTDSMKQIALAISQQPNVVSVTIFEEDHDILFIDDITFDFVNGDLATRPGNLSTRSGDIIHNSKLIGTVKITVSDAVMLAELKRTYMMSIVILIILLVGLFITISLLTLRITKPLYEMKQFARSIADGDLSTQMTPSGSSEVMELGEALTIMQDRIKQQASSIQLKMDELVTKSEIIQNNNVEIQALYEETTAMNEELSYYVERQKEDYRATIMALANAIEANDSYTRGHCERVRFFTMEIAKHFPFSTPDLEHLEYAAVLHDIGKIGVPMSIIQKPGRLTSDEYDIIKTHPTLGYQIIRDIDFLQSASTFVHQHHERIDGHGYPQGLKGDEITLQARILAVADAYDAMTSKRVYRKQPLTPAEALAQLEEGLSTQYDLEVVKAFKEILANLDEDSDISEY